VTEDTAGGEVHNTGGGGAQSYSRLAARRAQQPVRTAGGDSAPLIHGLPAGILSPGLPAGIESAHLRRWDLDLWCVDGIRTASIRMSRP